jgi:hypothetical protein
MESIAASDADVESGRLVDLDDVLRKHGRA